MGFLVRRAGLYSHTSLVLLDSSTQRSLFRRLKGPPTQDLFLFLENSSLTHDMFAGAETFFLFLESIDLSKVTSGTAMLLEHLWLYEKGTGVGSSTVEGILSDCLLYSVMVLISFDVSTI